MLAESVASKDDVLRQKCNAILESENRFNKMKAQCESIVNDFRRAEQTANTARAIIDSYKQSLV
jgi:hypothetical protein